MLRLNIGKRRTFNRHHAQLRAMEASSEGIAILDHYGFYVYLNDAHARCHGYSVKELEGRHWDVLYDEETGNYIKKDVFPVFRQHGKWKGQLTGRKKDGTPFPQEVSLNALEDGSLVCVVRDITERLNQEDNTRRNLAAIEASMDGIAITDSKNRFLYINESFMKVHGLDPEEKDSYLGTDWRHVYNEVGQGHINEVVLPTTVADGVWYGDLTVARKDGSLFWADASLTRLADGTQVGVMRDVTARRKAEKERNELQDQLFQSQKLEALGRLAGGVSHDFNNILEAMMVHCESLIGDLNDRPEQKRVAEKIRQTGEQGRALIEQMMTFSRSRPQSLSVIDLRQAVSGALAVLGAGLPPAVRLDIDLGDGPLRTKANSTQIGQAVLNLCLNARDALAEGAGSIKVRLAPLAPGEPDFADDMFSGEGGVAPARIRHKDGWDFFLIGRLRKEQAYARITVADTGSGIPPHIVSNVFDPFFTTKPAGQGTGLGLATVRHVVLCHKGAMILKTRQGAGTSFDLFLPLEEN